MAKDNRDQKEGYYAFGNSHAYLCESFTGYKTTIIAPTIYDALGFYAKMHEHNNPLRKIDIVGESCLYVHQKSASDIKKIE